jgi:hypothetical protein
MQCLTIFGCLVAIAHAIFSNNVGNPQPVIEKYSIATILLRLSVLRNVSPFSDGLFITPE